MSAERNLGRKEQFHCPNLGFVASQLGNLDVFEEFLGENLGDLTLEEIGELLEKNGSGI